MGHVQREVGSTWGHHWSHWFWDIMTHYAAVDGSEEERSVIVHHLLTFQVSGRVRRAGKNGCGL